MLQREVQQDDEYDGYGNGVLGSTLFSVPSKKQKYLAFAPENMFQEFSYRKFLMCKTLNFLHPKCLFSSLHHG